MGFVQGALGDRTAFVARPGLGTTILAAAIYRSALMFVPILLDNA